ncbi:MAG: adenosylcobinamide-GDP ribazoletransferase, partial [Myxococcota bacterium]|nr:adenosylcobinamide-GDP ribazoletransferase [Myxococcota bacterium]
IGALLGLAAGATTMLVGGSVPPLLLAALLLAASGLLTGGLHLDGLADVFDALGAGGSRERQLEIMRDSRIGAHGAAGLLFGTVVKVAALAPVVGEPIVIALVPALGRWALAILMVAFPYARAEGLGRTMKDHAGVSQVALGALPVAALVALAGPTGWVAAGVGLCGALLVGAAIRRRLGGLTGDVYGLCLEVAETGALVAASAMVG